RTERMPPWEVDTHYGKIVHDDALTTQQKKALYAWFDADCPEGKPLRKKPEKKSKEDDDFEPDLELKVKSEIEIPAETEKPWHYEEVIANNPEDIWFATFKPQISNPSAVQHTS